jgi:FLVCR family MFS transporter 7
MTDLSLVVRDFGFTLDEVNWLGNIISCVYLPTAVLTSIVTKRYGLKRCVCSVSFYAVYLLILLLQCDIATALVLLSAWIRYAGTSRSLSKGGAYSLIIFGQVGKKSQNSLLTFTSHALFRPCPPFRSQYTRF